MRRLSLCSILVGMLGCGVGSSAPKTYGDFTNAISQAYCSLATRCQIALGVKDCNAAYGAFLGTNQSTYSPLVSGGTVKYDPSAAKACLDAYTALDCKALTSDAAAASASVLKTCRAVVTGTVAEGKPCRYSIECASDNCTFPAGGHEGCDGGTCSPADPTRACLTDGCGVDQVCTSTDGKTYSCVDKGDTGASCSTSGSCKSGLACLPGSSGFGGTCGAISGSDGPCIDKCSGDLRCVGGKCGTAIAKGGDCSTSAAGCAPPNVCVGNPPNATCQPTGDGQPCANDFNCGSFFFYYCQKADATAATGTCVASPLPGEACDPTAMDSHCTFSFCDPATSKCKAPLRAGETCDPAFAGQPSQCESNTTCDMTSKTCTLTACG